jgi:predicted nicotinamide N-methyase
VKEIHALLAYQMKRDKVRVGSMSLEIESLDDLNRTIDQVFEILEKEGRPELLEKLCPYFGVVWPSALALAQWLAETASSEIQGREILELGCGLAIPSLVASRRGARVTATDFHPEVPRFLAQNRILNGAPVEYIEADWMQEVTPALEGRSFDLVVGSDILYERHYAAPVAQAFARYAKPGATLLLADPGRPYLQAFDQEMKKLGLTPETRILKVQTPETREIFLLEVRKPA